MTDTAAQNALTVSALTSSLKALLEDSFPAVCVTGEISNFKHHSSGHMYFSLKDEKSQMRCVMWRWQNQALRFIPEDGMQVILRGDISVYESRGEYQLVTQSMQPAGAGALLAAFERLKERLASEGLFDSERKRPLPFQPERVGVITSQTGAAVRDIIRILHRRAPWVQIILWSVRVQGDGAASEIAAAIEGMNAYGQVDVIIVGRGGGSMEDLWAFNEEVVVRALVNSAIPTISAVGHEVDVTLADFAADVRAPTPSGAAEQVVRDRQEMMERVSTSFSRLYNAVTGRILQHRQMLELLMSSHGLRRPLDLVTQRAQTVDEFARRLLDTSARQLDQRTHALHGLAGRLNALNPLAVLERGYAVCRSPEGKIIRDAGILSSGDQLDVKFHKGQVTCRVESPKEKHKTIKKTPRARKPSPGEDLRIDLFDE